MAAEDINHDSRHSGPEAAPTGAPKTRFLDKLVATHLDQGRAVLVVSTGRDDLAGELTRATEGRDAPAWLPEETTVAWWGTGGFACRADTDHLEQGGLSEADRREEAGE